MENNFKHIINNHESAVNPMLFDNIIAIRNQRKRKRIYFYWGITISAAVLFAFSAYALNHPYASSNSTPIATQKVAQNNETATIKYTTNQSQPVSNPTQTTAPTSEATTASTTSKSPQTSPFNNHSLALKVAPTKQKKAIPTDYPKMPPSFSKEMSKDMAAKVSSPSVIFAKDRLASKTLRPLPNSMAPALTLPNPNIFYSCPNNDCYAFTGRKRKGQSKFFIDLLGSPDYVKANMGAKSTEFNSYVKERLETEDFYTAYSAQFGLGVETGVGIIFRTGINLSRYETRFRKSDPNFKKVTIEQIFDANGNLIGTQTVTTYGSLDIQHYNRHQYIDIPLTIGITTSGRKIDFGINAGLQFNISTESTGRFIGLDHQTTNFTLYKTSSKPAYRTRISTQPIANVTMAYEINDHLDIIVAPHFKITPKSITTKDYPIDEQLMTAGLWIGGRYRW